MQTCETQMDVAGLCAAAMREEGAAKTRCEELPGLLLRQCCPVAHTPCTLYCCDSAVPLFLITQAWAAAGRDARAVLVDRLCGAGKGSARSRFACRDDVSEPGATM